LLTNDDFHLTDEQLRAYNDWATKVSAAHFNADAGESLEISIRFSFSLFGREVIAVVGASQHKIVLESPFA
jgi:hypothetical protein